MEYLISKRVSVDELLDKLQQEYSLVGDRDQFVDNVAAIEFANDQSLCFLTWTGERGIKAAESTAAPVILCSSDLPEEALSQSRKTYIVVNNPRLAFAELEREFFIETPVPTIDPTAVIAPGASIASNVSIGAHTNVESDSSVGEGSSISSNVYIGPGVKIGKRVIIHSGARIGADGFSFELTPEGKWFKFPQVAGVTIEDDVEIGANTCIDRGALVDTFIGEGSKLDNLTHIAHNVRIEPHCIIVAEVFIGGSSIIGSYTWIAPQVCVRDRINIGQNVLVGMGSTVTKDVPDNSVVIGSPAKVISENRPLPWETT